MHELTADQYEKHRGMWVAEYEGDIVASGRTYDEALEKAKQKGYETPSSLARIPKMIRSKQR